MATVSSWQKPTACHCAFNPILFIASLSGSGVETVTLKIYDSAGTTLLHTLTAESFGGTARFDISSIIRAHLASQLSNTLSADPALSFQYTVKGENTSLGSFSALNAVAQVQESPDRSAWNNAALTRFQGLKHYAGYELTVGKLESGVVNRYAYSSGATFQSLPVESCCIPEQPFYVRWINQQGGVDYWMFSRRQEFEQTVKSVSSHELLVDNIATARANSRAYAMTTENRVTVGTEGVSAADYAALRLLPFSPSIEWYDESRSGWIALSPAKFSGKFQTQRRLHDIEITFDLPRLNTQF